MTVSARTAGEKPTDGGGFRLEGTPLSAEFPEGKKYMNEVNKTLYIPLYGKSKVSRQGIILSDPAAERIWQEEAFPIHGRSASKWLA